MLASYRRQRLRDNLELLPLTILLKVQAKKSLTSQPAHPKGTKSAANGTPNANGWLARLKNFLSRRRCLQPARVWLIQSRRKMMTTMVTICLRALRSQMARRRPCRGNQTPCRD